MLLESISVHEVWYVPLFHGNRVREADSLDYMTWLLGILKDLFYAMQP